MGKPTYEELEKRLLYLEKSEQNRKRMEKALRHSEDKYKILSENIAHGFFRSTTGSQGKFIEVNSAFVDILGYNKKQDLYTISVADIYQFPADRFFRQVRGWISEVICSNLIPKVGYCFYPVD